MSGHFNNVWDCSTAVAMALSKYELNQLETGKWWRITIKTDSTKRKKERKKEREREREREREVGRNEGTDKWKSFRNKIKLGKRGESNEKLKKEREWKKVNGQTKEIERRCNWKKDNVKRQRNRNTHDISKWKKDGQNKEKS
jgi:hypothetical protein